MFHFFSVGYFGLLDARCSKTLCQTNLAQQDEQWGFQILG
jgi:hypothetical protein